MIRETTLTLAALPSVFCGADVGSAQEMATGSNQACPSNSGCGSSVVGSVDSCCSRSCSCSGGNSCCEEGRDCCESLFQNLLGKSGCEAYGGCCPKPKLLGLFTASDCRFSDFISPISNPVYFEDPRNLTEVRGMFINNQIPNAVLGGGDVQLLAAQFRAAVTDRLSIIAVKDGYVFSGADSPHISGWANVTAGLKYVLYADPVKGRLLSVGTRIEMPTGSYHALQGNSQTSAFDIFASAGTRLGYRSHFLTTAGFRLPADPNKQNDQFFWSFHFDRRMQNRPIYGLLEFNWYHWLTNVQGGPPFGGLDMYNFGSSGVAGTNIVTAAIGAKYKPSPAMEIGVCWEVPLTERRDILDNRITADLILRY